jgi:hypothetical protein
MAIDADLSAGMITEEQARERRDLGDAAGALGDHDEIDDDQDHEDGEADDDLAAHQEFAERADHAARRAVTFMAVRQDQAGRGEVQAEPQHRRDQQDRREGAEFQRLLDEERGHQDHHGNRDRQREPEIEQPARHRQDQHADDRDDRTGEREVAVQAEAVQEIEDSWGHRSLFSSVRPELVEGRLFTAG